VGDGFSIPLASIQSHTEEKAETDVCGVTDCGTFQGSPEDRPIGLVLKKAAQCVENLTFSREQSIRGPARHR